jgi:hypothetical protein
MEHVIPLVLEVPDIDLFVEAPQEEMQKRIPMRLGESPNNFGVGRIEKQIKFLWWAPFDEMRPHFVREIVRLAELHDLELSHGDSVV